MGSRSSIALLQERFRELHRVKVVRQHKEEVLRRKQLQLSNSLSDNPSPNQYSINFNYELLELAERESSRPLFLHRSTSPSSQLSLWPTTSQLHNKRNREDDEDQYYTRTKMRRRKFINKDRDEIPLLINLWQTTVTHTTTCSSSSSSLAQPAACSTSNKYLETRSDYCNNSDDDDVDTSLHL